MIAPVAVVRSTRALAHDDDWDREVSRIELLPPYSAESLAGLDQFSHCEIVYVFDRVDEKDVVTTARHPRGRADWPKVGIFAQRGKARPNRLGVCVCRVVRVHGAVLHVSGLDAIDGTPVVDIKPVWRAFLPRGDVVEPAWVSELTREYWAREPGSER
jgi:tRNA-Thr(GGU) m(6)t(6)A37 methyltransferase TsaA